MGWKKKGKPKQKCTHSSFVAIDGKIEYFLQKGRENENNIMGKGKRKSWS